MWGWIAMNNMYPTYHNTWDLHVLWEIECNIYKGLDFCRKRTYKFRFCRGDKCLTFIRVWTFVKRVRPTKESILERCILSCYTQSLTLVCEWPVIYAGYTIYLLTPQNPPMCGRLNPTNDSIVFLYIYFWGLIQQITL